MQIQNWQLKIDNSGQLEPAVFNAEMIQLLMTESTADRFRNSIYTVLTVTTGFFQWLLLEFTKTDFALAQTSVFSDTAAALGRASPLEHPLSMRSAWGQKRNEKCAAFCIFPLCAETTALHSPKMPH